jgi:DHA1 family bicyclomycin/chloramphenicol resistance-like MFS transporter
MMLAGWRGIFGSFLIFALITITWFAIRIPETLAPENRAPFSLKRILSAVQEIIKIRPTVGYALTGGLLNGIFIGYLNSSQQIFQEQYVLGERFPLFFAINALSLGLAALVNSQLVMRYGMHQLVRWAMRIEFGLAVLFLGIAVITTGQPPLWALMAFLMMSFFCTGVLFGNMNSLAMQPLGHLAGIGAAAVGSFSTLISMLLGTLIGRSYNGTILPLVIGMFVLSGASMFVIRWAQSE